MLEKKNIILDCDPGIDDALALMLALSSPELNICGITTVSGNVPSDMGAYNALRTLHFMNRLDIPVYCGAKTPLVRNYVSAQDTHGADGLGESNISSPQNISWRTGAVDFILETLRTTTSLTIVALGPLTNIALALRRDKKAFQNLSQLISMGGNFRSYGNCSPVAEYNYWCDPDAASEVFENLGKPIHMVGLDVTRKIVLTPNLLEYMRILNPDTAEFIQKITRFYMDFHWKQEGIIGCVINDPLAVAYAVKPDICQGFDAYTAIETNGICIGQSVVDSMNFWRRKPNSHILTQTNPIDFMTMFISRMFRKEPNQIQPILSKIMTGV
ncbi:MAG: PreQ1-regulate dinosine-uridine nucleoside hydrolase [Oscillospiraceae bacterium]|jgi:purine nucleosidase